MRKIFVPAFVVLAICSSFVGTAIAQTKEVTTACSEDNLIYATGNPNNPYAKMYQNIKGVYSNLCEYTATTGGFDNVLLILNRKADLGMAQADVMDVVKRTEPVVTQKVRALLSFHSNIMHFIVHKDGMVIAKGSSGILGIGSTQDQRRVISDIRELKDQKVAVFGSAVVTAMLIDERLKLNMERIEVTKPEEGMAKVKNGEVAAFLAMGGKPIKWVEEADGNIFTLANFDPSEIQRLGEPYKASKLTYKNLNVFGVNALGVRNDLLVWNFSGKRAQQLLDLRQAILENLEDLKEARTSHPAWQDVENPEEVYWTKYEPKLKQAPGTAKK